VPTATNTATATNAPVPTATNTATATNTPVPTATNTATATNISCADGDKHGDSDQYSCADGDKHGDSDQYSCADGDEHPGVGSCSAGCRRGDCCSDWRPAEEATAATTEDGRRGGASWCRAQESTSHRGRRQCLLYCWL
jgi:hypothetical protein